MEGLSAMCYYLKNKLPMETVKFHSEVTGIDYSHPTEGESRFHHYVNVQQCSNLTIQTH